MPDLTKPFATPAEDRIIHIRQTMKSPTSVCGRTIGVAEEWKGGNVWVLPEQFTTLEFKGVKCSVCEDSVKETDPSPP